MKHEFDTEINMFWENINTIKSKKYKCGYCGQPLASDKGWVAIHEGGKFIAAYIYVCHHCKKPTFFDNYGNQTPGTIFGNDVAYIDDKTLEKLYNEARKCTGYKAFTASVLCCRKLLMHIAVSKGADSDLNFIEYVDYLFEKDLLPSHAKDWVDHIRKKGNEANHEIVIMNKKEAEDLITFSEMLLRLVYEFPAKFKKRKK